MSNRLSDIVVSLQPWLINCLVGGCYSFIKSFKKRPRHSRSKFSLFSNLSQKMSAFVTVASKVCMLEAGKHYTAQTLSKAGIMLYAFFVAIPVLKHDYSEGCVHNWSDIV